MQYLMYVWCIVCIGSLAHIPHTASAAQEFIIQPVSHTQDFRFNNENWNQVPHPEVASFVIFTNGEMIGTTTTGIPFEQRIFENEKGVKVHAYSIQDHYHYILRDRVYFTTGGLLSYLSSLPTT